MKKWTKEHANRLAELEKLSLEAQKKNEPKVVKKYALGHAEIMAKEIPPDKPILGEWLSEKGLAEIYAPTGIGKTWLTLSIALSIAYQKNLMNWKAHTQKNVLYIDGEMSPKSIQTRIDRIGRGMSIQPDPYCFAVLNTELCDVTIPDVLSPEGHDFLHDQAKGFQVIILDSLLTLSAFSNETESKAMQSLKELLLSFRRKGVSVIFVHHSGKSGAQLGSVMKEIYLNSVLGLSRPVDLDDEIGCCFDIAMNKARDSTSQVSRTKRAELVDCADGSVKWLWKDSSTLLKEAVLEMFNVLKMKQGEIAKELGINLSIVKKFTAGIR